MLRALNEWQRLEKCMEDISEPKIAVVESIEYKYV